MIKAILRGRSGVNYDGGNADASVGGIGDLTHASIDVESTILR